MSSNKNDIELPLLPRGNSGHKRSKIHKTSDAVKIEISPAKNPISHFIEYINPSNDPKKYAPKATFFEWLTFSDLMPYAKKMNKATKIEINEIPNPEYRFNVESKLLDLDRHWHDELKKDSPNFSRALYLTFLKEISSACVLFIIDNTTKIYYSVYVGIIVNIMSSTEIAGTNKAQELLSAGIWLTLLVVISLFAKNWALFTMQSNLGRARLAICGLLYKKLNSTSLTSLHEVKLGKVINLLSNDLNEMQTLHMAPHILTTPFMIALGTYMMWEYFSVACLVGLGGLFGVLFFQIYSSNLTENPRRENKRITDERVKLTHEIIEGIRLIKMYTWEKFFKDKALDYRQKEEGTFMKTIRLDAISRNISGTSIYIIILIVCTIYILFDGSLSPDKIYASMMILMYLSSNLVSTHQGRMGLVNFRMISKRIEEVLTIKDVLSLSETTRQKNLSQYQDYENSKGVVSFENFTGYWQKNSQKPCLTDINLVCKPGALTTVIGKIGSGKTSLLLSFLRELPVTSGKLDYNGQIAYVEQDPIIFSGTFRENILFGKEFDEELYKQVLRDCKLEQDLETFSHGDQTYIGERGVNLSGGQKARVSLARAFYSQSDIYLLDDPFAALDSRVARDIFDRVIKSKLAKNKTVILVTHHLHFARESEHVVLMDEGKIEAQGTFFELEKLNIELLNVFKVQTEAKKSSDHMTEGEKEKKPNNGSGGAQSSTTKPAENNPNSGKGLREESAPVTWQTYKDYFTVKGTRNYFLFLASLFIIPHCTIIYYTRFLGSWATEQTQFYNDPDRNENDTFNNGYYIILCILMLLLILLTSYAKYVNVYGFLLSNNTILHTKMINALIRSTVLFFDINPSGRILNRFANDLGVLDKNNARMTFELLDSFVSHFSLLITVCLISPLIFIPTVIVIYVLFKARMFFDKPLMMTKKLELATKSPMISAVPATLQGLIIIRVYNQGGRFVREFMDMVYNSTKTFVFLTRTSRLFAIVLETPIQLLTVTGVWIFIIIIMNYEVDPGLLGLSLMYLLKIGSHSTLMIRQTLEVDVNMQSAQRMLDYCKIKSEAPDYVENIDQQVHEKFQGNWPVKGDIHFNKVFMKYREELGYALNDFSLKITGGQKVACVGRTGAGKSSIIQALFRMVEIEKGPNFSDSRIMIDGINIGLMGLHTLRNKISIIPQVPVIFAGTIKRNLDLFMEMSNYELWRVLEQVGLKDHIESLPNKLETDMTVSSTVFSMG